MTEASQGKAIALKGDALALHDKLEEIRFADYFTILGFAPEDPLPAGSVERNYRALRQRFEPSRFAGVADRSVESDIDEVRRGLDDAYEVLSDPLLRERYRKSIRS